MAFFNDLGKIEPILAPPPVKRLERTMGDIGVISEAQKMYNPQIKSVPAAQADQGTAANAGMGGAWGKPNG